MTAVRFGLQVDDINGYHVRFRLFAATGGEHLGGCGNLVMRTAEYAALRQLLEPALTDRHDPVLDRDETEPLADLLAQKTAHLPHTHACATCSPDGKTPGPGCLNCRHTGLDQTPCQAEGHQAHCPAGCCEVAQ